MSKILRVTDKNYRALVGDKFELSEDGKEYISQQREELSSTDDNNAEMKSTFTSTITISPAYAEILIKEGVLEEVKDGDKNSKFVNIFDEIDKLLDTYTTGLKNVDEEMKDAPECLKVEKITVLRNLIKILTHLKNLKK